MLTLTVLENHVKQGIEGVTTLPQSISLVDCINFAGRWFFSINPWNFRDRPPVLLSLRKDIPYMDLPSDFGEQLGYQMSDGLNFGITFTTIQQLMHLRATTVTVSQNYYWGSIVQPSQPAPNLPMPPPRVEIWPTPAADQEDLVSIAYRAKWRELIYQTNTVTEDDVANVPDYADMCLIEAAKAFAIGWGERQYEPMGGVHGILKLLMEGPLWAALVATDGLQQVDQGLMMGGAIQARYPSHTWRSASASPVSGPA